MSPARRMEFLSWAFSQEGAPYIWGAKGPNAFDCSGLVTAGYLHVGLPDWRQTHNAQGLAEALPVTATPRPGDLAVYGSGPHHVSHVMIFAGDGRVFGACGGNRDTTTAEIAHDRGASVKFKPHPRYRPDLLGFRSSPFPEGEDAWTPPLPVA